MKRGDLNSLSSPHDRLIVTGNIEYVNEVGHRSRSTGLIFFSSKTATMQKMLAASPARCNSRTFDGNADKVYYPLCDAAGRSQKSLSSRANRRRQRRKRWGEGRAVLRAVEDERVVATFTIYFSRATGSKSNDHPTGGVSTTAEKLAGTGRAVFPGGRERGPRLAVDGRERDGDFKTVNHRPYTPRMTARVGKRESKEKLGGKKRRSGEING